MRNFWVRLFLVIISFVFLPSCKSKQADSKVVIYTAADQIFSEPILKEFESKTGIKVLAVYDVEATKVTGLVNRLIAEKDRPQADVFWNGEFSQTLLLKEKGVLDTYFSGSAQDIPNLYKDPQGYWTGVGGRARVMLVNTDKLDVSMYPKSILDILKPEYSAKEIGMAYPLFGTTLTQAAAFYAFMGPEKAKDFYQKIRDRGIRVVDGNSTVRDLVAKGELSIGLTDSDDACGAIKNNAPVKVIFPDQDSMGTLVIASTIALIKGANHPKEARQLIDYLLSAQVEQKLIDSGAVQMSLRPSSAVSDCVPLANVKGIQVSFSDIYKHLSQAAAELREIFIR